MNDKLLAIRRSVSVRHWLGRLGGHSIDLAYHTGGIVLLLRDSVATLFSTPLRWSSTLDQNEPDWSYLFPSRIFNSTFHRDGPVAAIGLPTEIICRIAVYF